MEQLAQAIDKFASIRNNFAADSAFADYSYPNEIGPGVYDIHSPRVPSEEDIGTLLHKAAKVIPPQQLWVNPDCGLKTRAWPEVEAALVNMVAAAQNARREIFTEGTEDTEDTEINVTPRYTNPTPHDPTRRRAP